jgi:RES domain-containing protein
MILYRLATYGNPLRTQPARHPGRYHTGSETAPTQYLCLHPLGPFAELLRGNTLRHPEQARQVRERTWALRFEQDGLLEIGFDNANEFGLDPKDLVDDDVRRCQACADELRNAGSPGIIVPSAALAGTRNLVLFGPRVGSPYLLEPLGAVDVPASITADGGRPPVSLLALVRFRGDSHAALDAWHRRDRFEFDEPDWQLTHELP